MDVLFAGHGNESPSDLDWPELGNYGADSEAVQYLQNNEGARGYEELKGQADVGDFKVPPKRPIFARAER